VHFAVDGQALDGGHAGAVCLHRQHVAGLHRAAVQVDGAGAALGGVAAHVRAGEAQLLAQELDEKGVGSTWASTGLPLTVRRIGIAMLVSCVGARMASSIHPDSLRGTGHDAVLPFG
jgi:hypothetical protein